MTDRPILPVAAFPKEKVTPIAVGMFGQGVAGWLVGTKLVNLALALDARDGRQECILTFNDGQRDLRLVIKDRRTPGLDLSITSARPRYLNDEEVDALVAKSTGATETAQGYAIASPAPDSAPESEAQRPPGPDAAPPGPDGPPPLTDSEPPQGEPR